MINNYDMSFPDTPPMSVSDGSRSPLTYTTLSPGGYITQTFQNNFGISNPGQSNMYLKIIEEPVDKFRFRYKSEMAGTHGSLNGNKSDKNRKQTFPTVKLMNCKEPAIIIRCSLYQCSQNPSQLQPHAHRLVMKHGNREVDDPHDKRVTATDDYTAIFAGMGIIHTARKYVVDELFKKKKKVEEERVAREENYIRDLKTVEITRIQKEANEDAKSINLNVVCLRYDAFKEDKNGILHPLCDPVYSRAINNLKSALTGDLKIVRMDRCTSPAVGGKEVYLLVEKVTKKNIKVKFYELNDDDEEIWSNYATFNDIDVHHQYAIVIKTPPYRDPTIENEVKVLIQLERPTDGARSAPLEFTYYPDRAMRRKRPRYNYSSSTSASSTEIPAVLMNMDEMQSFNINSEELMANVKNINSEEFSRMIETLPYGSIQNFTDEPQLIHEYIEPNMGPPVTVRGPTLTQLDNQRPATQRSPVALKRNPAVEIINRTKSELIALIKTKPSELKMKDMLKRWLQTFITEDKNNCLHLSLMSEHSDQHYLNYFYQVIHCLKVPEVLDYQNNAGQTLLHLACLNNRATDVNALIKLGADPLKRDVKLKTPLHYAVKNNNVMCAKHLLTHHEAHKLMNTSDCEGDRPLLLAIQHGQLDIVKELVQAGADVNDYNKHDGYSALQMAISGKYVDIARYLLEHPVDLLHKNYKGMHAYHLCCSMEDDEKVKSIKYEIEKKANRLNLVNYITKLEPDSDSDIDINETVIKPDPDLDDLLLYQYEEVKAFTIPHLKDLGKVLDNENRWKAVAIALDLDFILDTFSDVAEPTKEFMEFALANEVSFVRIRQALLQCGFTAGVEILDNMVRHICDTPVLPGKKSTSSNK